MSTSSKRHPANNGRVMLTAWVDPALRDYIRREAKRTGLSMSELIESAVRGMIGSVDRNALAGAEGEAIRWQTIHGSCI